MPFSLMRWSTVMLSVFVCWCSWIPECSAGIDYTLAGVDGTYSVRGETMPQRYGDYWSQGAAIASARASAGSSSASASISLLNNPGIRLTTQGTPNLDEGTAQAAVAQWRDVIRLSGTSELPDSIRVTISVSGIYKASGGSMFSRDETRVFVSSQGGFENGLISSTSFTPGVIAGSASNLAQGFSAYNSNVPIDHRFEVTNAQDFSYDSGSGAISWKANFVLSYAPNLGGYSMNLLFTDENMASFGRQVNADFGSTFRLTGVTRSDGSALPGTVAFESGFQLQSVPEPSSVLMVGSGVLGSLAYIRRRKAA